MRRTQLSLDNNLWEALDNRARMEKTTVSELVRQAVREGYFGDREQRREAMRRFVGIREPGASTADSTEEVRMLRHGSRLLTP